MIYINYLFKDLPVFLILLFMQLFPNHLYINKLRGILISPFLGSCGKNLQIGRGVILNNPGSLYVGNDCYISHNCYVQAKGIIELGNNVIIGPMCILATSNHKRINGVVTNQGINRKIIIGSNTFCGGNTTILSGIIIGYNVTVGAGSVVSKNIDDNSFIIGNPIIKKNAD